MELVLTRIAKRKTYTIGRLAIKEQVSDEYLAGEAETYFCDTLKPIPGAPQTVYRYEKVPYQPCSFQRDTFIPLVLYGSFWWDEDAKAWRFCGTEELTDEKAKTSNFFKDSPHYYIIGAIFHK